MKTISETGTLYVTSKASTNFANAALALIAMQSLQLVMATQGKLVTSRINLPRHTIEMTVHFDKFNELVIPRGYGYSEMELSSQPYFNRYTKEAGRIRTACFIFKFNEQ